uniref:putative F-box/FBD/LRR-repeat protein At4g03220 n=1 Tax=Fragaria vesca subsp. vesca TaxID=101020 RepID=UPI0005C9B383|nr:PREDICTED: putative F-box/FBD/LRR-repeat protein At4g03220 [Fragaria vesca subsp. vesca]
MENVGTTASCQTRGAACKEFIDRFSDLPDEIAHQILSLLNLRDLTRVSCVSKRCTKLYLSLPSLNFDTTSSVSMWKRLQVFNSSDRFLSSLDDNTIQYFRIRWTYYPVKNSSHFNELYRIFTWIRNAIRGNVEVFDLQLDTLQKTPLVLPSWFFHCSSLKYLLFDFGGDILKWPSSSACFPNLQVLKFRKFKIQGEEYFFKWILCSRKSLKKLHLEEVRGIKFMTIESLSLESFCFVHYFQSDLCHLKVSGQKLENIHISWEFDSSSRRSLHICTPNLKYLKWSGSLMDNTDLGDLMCLEKAEIFLEPLKEDYVKVFETLDGIRMLKALSLNQKTTKALFREHAVQALFENISHLQISITSLSDDLIPSMVSLPRGMTTLSTFYIHSDPSFIGYPVHENSVSTYSMSYWISQNLSCICRLEEVRLELSDANERELACYILEHAKNLKKMVILYSPSQAPGAWFLRIRRIVSTATVVFKNRYSS